MESLLRISEYLPPTTFTPRIRTLPLNFKEITLKGTMGSPATVRRVRPSTSRRSYPSFL